MDYESARKRFGKRVHDLRKERNIKQEKLAERIGKSTEHVSFIERGERSPSFEVIIDLANALGVTPTDLINFDSTDQPLTNTALSVVSPNSVVDPIEEPIKGKEQRKTDIERLQAALNGTIPLQKLAIEYGIADIFQDNGGKVLQLLIIIGLRISPGREGNDAVDAEENEYELKTVNLSLSNRNPGVTTHHHLNQGIIDKYRTVKAWYFGIYRNSELIEIWKADPSLLEPKFQEWEERIRRTDEEINNPKIGLKLVRTGERIYST